MPRTAQKIAGELAGLAMLGDANEVMLGLTRMLKRMVAADAVAVYFVQPDGSFSPCICNVPTRRTAFNRPPVPAEHIPLLSPILHRRQPVPLEDIEDLLAPQYKKMLGRCSLVMLPMVWRNRVIGIVLLARRKARFASGELEAAGNIVSHAALVVNNLRQFDDSLDLSLDMAQRIDVILALDEINKAISSSLSKKIILHTALEHVERMLSCRFAAVLEAVKGELVVAAHVNTGEEVRPRFIPGGGPAEGSVLRRVMAAGETAQKEITAENAAGTLEWALLRAGIPNVLAVPLSGGNGVTGILVAGHEKPAAFSLTEVFTVEKIAGQLSVALENARLYENLKKLFINTVTSLTNAISAKSPWTKGHSERVMHTAGRIAREMHLPDETVERVRLGGLLHDIGKIGILETVLEKTEGLTKEESPIMRLHPQKGVTILEPIEQLRDVVPGILHHHERYDGSGYPDGLKGEDIPLEARIITVADAFDAMVASRPYRKGRNVFAALQELRACAGAQFDPKIVEIFCNYVENRMKRSAAHTEAPHPSPAPSPA